MKNSKRFPTTNPLWNTRSVNLQTPLKTENIPKLF